MPKAKVKPLTFEEAMIAVDKKIIAAENLVMRGKMQDANNLLYEARSLCAQWRGEVYGRWDGMEKLQALIQGVTGATYEAEVLVNRSRDSRVQREKWLANEKKLGNTQKK